MANTANYSWVKPTVGGDIGSWGTEANTLFDAVDTEVKNRQNEAAAAQTTANSATTTANNALPKSGGLMTGRLDVKVETLAQGGTGGATGAQTMDLTVAQYFSYGLTGNITFTITNVPGGAIATGLVVRATAAGSQTITWPASVKWPGGVTPVQTPSGTDIYALVTDDAGATWRGIRSGRDIR
jgi:hypothetical protein